MRTLLEIDRELEQVREKERTVRKLQAAIADLHGQISRCRTAVEEAREVLRREEADVEELERMSFASFLARLRGDREERLDQERREAVAAKARYDAARQELEDLEGRRNAVQRELSVLGDPSLRIGQLLKEKEQVLLGQGGTGRLAELVRELEQLDLRCREMDEALRAGDAAQKRLEETVYALNAASDMGAWDMLGGGMLVTMAKHERLDQARGAASGARQALSRFRTELADVADLQVPDIQIGDFASFADYFMDGFFVDMYVQDRISEARSRVSGVRMRVQRLVDQLCRQREALEQRRLAVQRERESLLTEG